MHSDTKTPLQSDWGPAAESWRQQTVPAELVRELRHRTMGGRRAGPAVLHRAWLPAVATLVLLLVALALREPEPRAVMRAELRKGRLHVIWFQPIVRETER